MRDKRGGGPKTRKISITSFMDCLLCKGNSRFAELFCSCVIPETLSLFMLSSASSMSFEDARYDSETNSSTSVDLVPESTLVASFSISRFFPLVLLSSFPTCVSFSMS